MVEMTLITIGYAPDHQDENGFPFLQKAKKTFSLIKYISFVFLKLLDIRNYIS